MSYYFFIGDTMLPVPPAKMSIKIKGKNKTIDLINEGEVNIIKKAGLTEIAFDARLPNRPYPFADYDTSLKAAAAGALFGSDFSFKPAAHFLAAFEEAKTAQYPLQLIICRMSGAFTLLFDTNMLVTLEDYSIEEDAKDGIDVTCPLKFKQYRPYGTKECEVTKDENGVEHLSVKETRPATGKTIPMAYKVRNEKSVWEVVKNASNGSLDWRSIMEKNGMSNPVADLPAGAVMHLV